jgi:queuine/archaeosine tRNA-ribosyltransferase
LHYYQDLMASLRKAINENTLDAFVTSFNTKSLTGSDK